MAVCVANSEHDLVCINDHWPAAEFVRAQGHQDRAVQRRERMGLLPIKHRLSLWVWHDDAISALTANILAIDFDVN